MGVKLFAVVEKENGLGYRLSYVNTVASGGFRDVVAKEMLVLEVCTRG